MKFILWGGIILFFGSLFLLISSYDNIRIEQSGTIVKMRIEKLPNSCFGTRVNHYSTLSYGTQQYIKQIPAGYCDKHHVGELIDMKFLEGSSVILFPNESAKSQFYSTIILGLIGIMMFVTQLIKIKKTKNAI